MKFLLTPELGRLAKWLRALGHDADIFKGKVPDLLAKATFEKRTVLTRWRALEGHRGTPVLSLKSDRVEGQLKELKRLRKVGLSEKSLFSRCLICNIWVKPIAKENVKTRVPPFVFKTQKDFSYCPSCGRVYWAATHWDRARHFLKDL